MTKNYYKILGVSELCSDSELKSAYRKLARKWHPDIAGNTEEVVAKFKEINEAYEVLSDKVKRAEFDTVNRYYNYSSEKSEYKNTSSSSTSKNATNPEFKNDNNKQNEQKFNGFNFNWEDFLSKYKEYSNKYEQSKRNSKKYSTNPETKSSNAKYGNSVRGNDINTDVEITIAEAVSGTTKVINMLNTQVCPKCNGRKFINGTACPHCKGKGINTDYRRFTVKIPAGVKDNSKIRLAGEGGQGINGGKNGDLYINVHIKPPIDYKIEGNNVLKTVTLTPYEAVLGDDICVKTAEGNVTVKISPNTQNGQKIRLSGCGVNVNGKTGDMILTVEIQIPKNISEQEIELYKRLREISSHNIR